MSVASSVAVPKNSFVRFQDYNPSGCVGEETFCLPMSDRANTKFQLLVTEFSENPIPEEASQRSFFAVYIPSGNCPAEYPFEITTGLDVTNTKKVGEWYEFAAPMSIPGQSEIHGVVNFTGDPGDTSEIIYDGQPYDIGQCFRLAIVEQWTKEDSEEVISQYILACTNCFIKVAGSCYLSMLLYGNDDNNHGFIYDVNGLAAGGPYQLFKNRAELPMYLRSPSLKSEESTYRRSDGTYQVLSSRIDEEFTLEVDRMPYALHKRLGVALRSDELRIMNNFEPDKEGDYYVCTDGYEMEEDFLGAVPDDWKKGSTKLTAQAPVSMINNNCA